MLDRESEQTREIYARYGLAMYEAQCVERLLAILLASQYGTETITAGIYEDRLAENICATFGRLASKFMDFAKDTNITWAAEVKAAADDRNWLAHDYWWDRAVEFCSIEGRNLMLRELNQLTERFDALRENVSELISQFLEDRGVSQDHVRAIEQQLRAAKESPPPRKRVPPKTDSP